MSNLNDLPTELAFLKPHLARESGRYCDAEWLKSDFDAYVWLVQAATPFTLDWRVLVGDTLLTDIKHRPLWKALRSWLILQTHLDRTSGRVLAAASAHNRLRSGLVWIDYFLLRAEQFGLHLHGMATLTSSDFTAALATIASGRLVSTTVYQWPQRLREYLLRQSSLMDDVTLALILDEAPFVSSSLPSMDDRITGLSDSELVRARAWLWKEGLYRKSGSTFRFNVNTAPLKEALYPNTLRGKALRVSAFELSLVPDYHTLREYPQAPVVSNKDDMMSLRRLEVYRTTLHSLGALRAEGHVVPVVTGTSREALRGALKLKPMGRVRTLPNRVVFNALRRAAEFALEHGEDLITGYLSVAAAAQQEDLSIQAFSLRRDITELLPPNLRALGVRTWSIERPDAGCGVVPDAPKVLGAGAYYAALRGNEGLYELLRVLYGAIQIIVGVLMARRSGELVDLECGGCLDSTRTLLRFRNRKSGVQNCRELEERPIPPLAVGAIALIERLQQGLIDAGVLQKQTLLFAPPAFAGRKALIGDYTRYYESLDFFCDYVETEIDSMGRRFYIRQHQLRRFFAMLFFWSSGLPGIDTLRWFLGHTDPAHLYHYITESTPGDVLRSVKSDWACEGLRNDAPEVANLKSAIKSRFDTDDLSLLDQDALCAHIDNLLEDGLVEIEPEFLDDAQTYRILVKVSPLATPTP